MNSQNKSSSNHNRRGNRRGRRSGTRNSRPSKPPKKLSLFEKIIAFFTGGASAASTSSGTRSKQSQPSSNRSAKRERPARKPQKIEVTSPRVYVGNLSFDASESDLTDLFNGIGIVNSAEIVFNRHTHRSKGFGFVQMQTVDEAKRAVEKLHDQEYMGRKLVVSGAKALDERKQNRTSSDSESVNGNNNAETAEPAPEAAAVEGSTEQ